MKRLLMLGMGLCLLTVTAVADDSGEMTPAELAIHQKIAALGDTYDPPETVAELFARVGFVTGVVYHGPFGDETLPVEMTMGWASGELMVAIAESCSPVATIVDYSDPDRLRWSSLDGYHEGWVVAYGDGLALQVVVGGQAHRLVLAAEESPDKALGPVFNLADICGPDGCGGGGGGGSHFKCQCSHATGACSEDQCTRHIKCAGGAGTCEWVWKGS
jgi:hypothetical protein